MRVQITNVFTNQTADLHGDPLTVEEQIRRFFHGGLVHVPHGDLQAVIEAAGRIHGYSVALVESVDYIPPKRRLITRPEATNDPWVREVDSDLDPTSL